LVAGLYTTHAAKSSDHQDTYNLATRSNTSADITDVYVFPAPDNANNVVFAMDVSPLIAPGTGTSHFFDPTILYQFKISHVAGGPEDQVIQILPTGTGSSQTVSLYGPIAPNEVNTVNTVAGTATGSAPYNSPTTIGSGAGAIQVFAGPRTDPFFFDLFAFFTFLGDRNYGTHMSQSDAGPETSSNPEGLSNGDVASNLSGLAPSYDKTGGTPGPNAPTMPSFNGFKSGTMSGANSPLGNYACSVNPASDTLFAGPFDVLSIVVEVPKSMLITSAGSTIHVWATASSSTGS
jgi:hypothetical protein